MILKKFRIKNFRAIIDTGWIDCENITAFAGENESGKTSVLLGLLKLMNTSQQVANFATIKGNTAKLAKIQLAKDVPIDRAEELMPDIQNTVFIEAEFQPDAEFNAQLKALNPSYKNASNIFVSKNYGSDYNLSILDQFEKNKHQTVIELFLSRLPVFLYFQEMTEIGSKINLVSLAFRLRGLKSSQKLTSKETVFYNLLRFLDIWDSNLIKSIEQVFGSYDHLEENDVDFERVVEKIPMFRARFDKGFAILNEEFKKWWGNDELTINYGTYKKGIYIRITDNDGKDYLLENRSTGFRRFFGLFLSFSVTGMKSTEHAILLFDEAGAALHPLTQKKLAGFFQELGKSTQILYNTHSSYMLPVSEMNRTRVVFKDETEHTVVSKSLTVLPDQSNEMSLFPIQSALAFHLMQSTLAGCLPIVVLNEEDRTYISLARNLLIATGNFKSIYETLIFSTGHNGIDSVSEMFSGGDESGLPVVLLPSTPVGRGIKKRLMSDIYRSQPQKLLDISAFKSDAINFEDLMPPEFIAIFASLYLKEILDNDFEYNKKEGNLINQIEGYAQAKKIVLPANYRQEVAKRMRIGTMKHYRDVHVKPSYMRMWKKIWDQLILL